MPLFEFECRECGHRFETLVFATSRTTPACPSCDSKELQKLYSVFGVGAGGAGTRRSTSTVPVFSGG
jgi:putative FmdB family regulatory protein